RKRLTCRICGIVASPTPTVPISADSTSVILSGEPSARASRAAVSQPAVPPPTITRRRMRASLVSLPMPAPGSLSDFDWPVCESGCVAHISAISCPIEPLWGGELSKICPHTAGLSPQPSKPDRLLACPCAFHHRAGVMKKVPAGLHAAGHGEVPRSLRAAAYWNLYEAPTE